MFDLLFEKYSDWKTVRAIRKHGWTAIAVGACQTEPGWVYTVGFAETLGCPEVVLSSAPPEIANGLLWEAYRQIRDGRLELRDFARWDLSDDFSCMWRSVHPSQIVHERFNFALWRRRRLIGQDADLSAFQLVFADLAGRFPWDQGHMVADRGPQLALYEPRA